MDFKNVPQKYRPMLSVKEDQKEPKYKKLLIYTVARVTTIWFR